MMTINMVYIVSIAVFSAMLPITITAQGSSANARINVEYSSGTSNGGGSYMASSRLTSVSNISPNGGMTNPPMVGGMEYSMSNAANRGMVNNPLTGEMAASSRSNIPPTSEMKNMASFGGVGSGSTANAPSIRGIDDRSIEHMPSEGMDVGGMASMPLAGGAGAGGMGNMQSAGGGRMTNTPSAGGMSTRSDGTMNMHLNGRMIQTSNSGQMMTPDSYSRSFGTQNQEMMAGGNGRNRKRVGLGDRIANYWNEMDELAQNRNQALLYQAYSRLLDLDEMPDNMGGN